MEGFKEFLSKYIGAIIGIIVAFALIIGLIYMIFRPYKEATTLTKKVRVSKKA